MASKESVKDIVREMRAYAKNSKVNGGEVDVWNWLADYAKRIEAAHKRDIFLERYIAGKIVAAKNAEIAGLRTLTTLTDDSEVIAELERRLKVAEDALEKIAKDDFCEHGEMAARALYDIRAIREEAKP